MHFLKNEASSNFNLNIGPIYITFSPIGFKEIASKIANELKL